MKTYVFEVCDSDGNDVTVYDAIVTADTRELAAAKLWEYLDEAYPGDVSDGGVGTVHPCDCHCEHRKGSICERCHDAWECSHGGLLTNEDADGPYGPQEFDTVMEALDARRRYYSLIDLTDLDVVLDELSRP
jgi:hypothetical protein